MQRLLYIFLLAAVPHLLSAQVVTGAWYGHADVQMGGGLHNNYLTELVIKQKGTKVEGIFGYYFRDKYQSFFIHGQYNPRTREVTILNIPLTYFNTNSTVNSVDCNTNFRGVLINSKMGSSVKGTFYHDDKYKYTCPDIKVSYTLDKSDNQHDSISSRVAENNRVWKPQADDIVVDVAAKAPPAASAVNMHPAEQPGRPDSAVAPMTIKDTATGTAVIAAPAVKPDSSVEDKKKITESFNTRKPSSTKNSS